MESADGAVSAVPLKRSHWRGTLLGAGLAAAAGFLVLFAPAPAQADDGDSGLLGGVVSELTGVVDKIVAPVVEPLPSVREVPVVGGLVGQVVDSKPVGAVTAPVSDLVDGLLGDTIASVPVVGDLLGDTPVGDITDPVAGTVDGALGQLVTGTGLPLPPVLVPQDGTPVAVAADAAVVSAASGAISMLIPVLTRIDGLAALAPGGEHSPFGGFGGSPGFPGDSMPTTAISSAGSTTGLAAAVLGAGLVILFFAGRLRPVAFRVPSSPTFDTDSSPD